MDQEARALIERLRDDTQDREVFDRCNAVLAVMPARYYVGKARPVVNGTVTAWQIDEFHGVSTITATEAEVEIITGERR